MPRGSRRKTEVPTDTQRQFELGDTAADIERRRREREERDERQGESRNRGTERGWREIGKRTRKEERRECELTIQTEKEPGEVYFPERFRQRSHCRVR